MLTSLLDVVLATRPRLPLPPGTSGGRRAFAVVVAAVEPAAKPGAEVAEPDVEVAEPDVEVAELGAVVAAPPGWLEAVLVVVVVLAEVPCEDPPQAASKKLTSIAADDRRMVIALSIETSRR